MKKQLLILLATITAISPVSTICNHGGAIAGGILGAAALTGIAAGVHHHRHHRDYYDDEYYRDVEEENQELREELAEKRRSNAPEEVEDIQPVKEKKVESKPTKGKSVKVEEIDEETAD